MTLVLQPDHKAPGAKMPQPQAGSAPRGAMTAGSGLNIPPRVGPGVGAGAGATGPAGGPPRPATQPGPVAPRPAPTSAPVAPRPSPAPVQR